MLVFVSFKKRKNMGSCNRKAMPVNKSINKESTKRSVTTVPNDLVNDTPSAVFNVPQRVTSPTRGITRLAA